MRAGGGGRDRGIGFGSWNRGGGSVVAIVHGPPSWEECKLGVGLRGIAWGTSCTLLLPADFLTYPVLYAIIRLISTRVLLVQSWPGLVVCKNPDRCPG